MKLSYEWLKEFIDTDKTPEEIAYALTMSGSEVEGIEPAGRDKVMSLEITSNRPDCLNMIGLARELSAVYDKDLRLPDFSIPEKSVKQGGPEVSCVIKNRELCQYYTARVITGINVRTVSEKIKTRLEALGLRPVNNVVDITNYLLMELGQPLHAFDLDRIKGGAIIVREAKKGEKIVTIDGVERELEAGMLVIADREKPVAVAGVMGGLETEVSENTRNILLESAYFDPASIRRTSRKLGLSSDSSYRFERGVDKEMVKPASFRAASMIMEGAGGSLGGFYEAGEIKVPARMIEFDIKKAGEVLGAPLEKKTVERVLRRLGMSVGSGEGSKITVRVPSFREDIKRDVDIIEEVARIHGYDKIPETLPGILPGFERKEKPRCVREKLVEKLSAMGLNEIMTYSLINENAADGLPGLVNDRVVLSNPLSEEQKVMVPNLLDGMLKAISWNINRKNKDLMFFEIGNVYRRAARGKGFEEIPALCVGMTGLARDNWMEKKRNSGFYDVKGVVEEAARALNVGIRFIPADVEGITPSCGVEISGEKETAGFIGEVAKNVLAKYDIEQDVFVAQIKLDAMFREAVLSRRYHSLPRFPVSVRDISILCDEHVSFADILNVIKETGEELIKDVQLADVYKGENIPSGKKSLTYSIKYGIDTRTLREEEIESIHARVKDALVKKLNVSFR